MTDRLSTLTSLPTGVSEAFALVSGFDYALRVGFSRLGADQVRAVDALAKSFVATPLEAPLDAAVSAVRRSEFLDAHLAALAVGRSALLGAAHDALAAQVAKALGRDVNLENPLVDLDAPASSPPQQTLLESVRAWLVEVALAGLGQLTSETVLPFAATLEKLQDEPALTRLASLLGGFVDELLFTLPIADDGSNLPLARWGDLWARAYVLALETPKPTVVSRVSGTFVVFGTDLRQHDTYLSAVFHGVLIDPAAKLPPRHVRATLSTYKVDVVYGGEAWGALATRGPTLLTALARGASLTLDAMPCTATGDLLWDDARATADAKNSANLHTTASAALGDQGATLVRAPLAGVDRHPVQLAELVYLADAAHESSTVNGVAHSALRTREGSIAVARERLSDLRDFDLHDCDGAAGVVGLLRFDQGRWALQPLAVIRGAGKKVSSLVAGALFAEAGLSGAGKKSSALPILRERAGKLLRRK